MSREEVLEADLEQILTTIDAEFSEQRWQDHLDSRGVAVTWDDVKSELAKRPPSYFTTEEDK